MAELKYRDPNTHEFLPIRFGGVPIGTVIAFAGTVAPDGWHLCDGTVHGSAELQAVLGSARTPDLRDRFVVSVGPSYAARATGGTQTETLSAAQSGNSAHAHGVTSGPQNTNHTHTYETNTAGSHTHGGGYRAVAIRNTDLSQTTGGEHVLSHTSGAQSAWPARSHSHAAVDTGIPNTNHTHTLTINASGAMNATAAHENMPPFYALCFIVRKA